MEKSEKLPPSNKSARYAGKAIGHHTKKKQHSANVEEDDFEEQIEEGMDLFRACDDKIIEVNRLKKFSNNLKLDGTILENLMPTKDEIKKLEVILKAGSEIGQEFRGREPSDS